jgi:hypothetical protein
MQSDDVQDFEGLDEDINNLSDNDQEPHLTRQDYERSLDQEPLFGNEESINNMGESDYQGIVDSIMVELQQKYNLRPRDKNSTTAPPKKILSRSKMNEAAQPSTEKQAAKTKTVETQAAKTKKLKQAAKTKQPKQKQRKPIDQKKEKQRSQPEKPKRQLEVSIWKMKLIKSKFLYLWLN